MPTSPVSLTDLSAARLREFVTSLGEPDYRAGQLMNWVYRRLAVSFEDMTDLPRQYRRKLAEEARLSQIRPVRELKGHDGTTKALLMLADGKTVESVLMSYAAPGGSRHTVCVSTQVGCPVGCPFCATGRQGFERNLTSGEIIDQVLYFARNLHCRGENLTNVVFMGMGEPLANYEAVRQAVGILNSAEAFGMGARHINISTSGLVPGIRRLGREGLRAGLAVSLHAASNRLRDKLVPVNRRYPLEDLLAACHEYAKATGYRVTFEYALFDGMNDSVKDARALSVLLAGMNCHVNLIAANPVIRPDFRPPTESVVLVFQEQLSKHNIVSTIRRAMGLDIAAGCGQLRSHHAPTSIGVNTA